MSNLEKVKKLLSKEKISVDDLEEICSLGVFDRHSTLPRGSAFISATSELPLHLQHKLIDLVNIENNSEIVCETIRALSHWGDSESVDAILDFIKIIIKNKLTIDKKVNEYVLYSVGAFSTIGGIKGTTALFFCLLNFPHLGGEIKWALKELVTGGSSMIDNPKLIQEDDTITLYVKDLI